MKCFHELDCNNLPDIQYEALTFLSDRYNLSSNTDLKTDLWLKIDTNAVVENCPSLMVWLKSLKLKLRETAVTVINDPKGAALHIDELPVTAKINIPIFNYANVVNEWYQVPNQIKETIGLTKNQWGNEFHNLASVDLKDCKLLASYILQRPVVFNSRIPHRVVVNSGAKFPRVVLTCMFFNEPLQYLQDGGL